MCLKLNRPALTSNQFVESGILGRSIKLKTTTTVKQIVPMITDFDKFFLFLSYKNQGLLTEGK